jgi:hypothetical protein
MVRNAEVEQRAGAARQKLRNGRQKFDMVWANSTCLRHQNKNLPVCTVHASSHATARLGCLASFSHELVLHCETSQLLLYCYYCCASLGALQRLAPVDRDRPLIVVCHVFPDCWRTSSDDTVSRCAAFQCLASLAGVFNCCTQSSCY